MYLTSFQETAHQAICNPRLFLSKIVPVNNSLDEKKAHSFSLSEQPYVFGRRSPNGQRTIKMTEIVLCKGFTQYVVSVNPGDKLSDLRKQITPSIIDEDDSNTGIWRFSSTVYESGDQETVAKSAERFLNVYGDGGFVESGNTLFLTNSRPAELIGATSTKFVKGQVECDIWGIDKFLTDKFRPMMFERVRAAEMTEVIYKNVLIGQEKTPLVIRVKVKGLSTFGCTIKRVSDNQPDAIIIDNLIPIAPADKNEAVLVKQIKPSIIDEDDSMKGIWRFSPKLYESGDQETVPKNAERLMKVYGDGGLIGSGKTLFVTNSRPAELIGATSTKFVKGQVECDIWGIDKFLTDKFRPMMFERVRAAEMTEVIYKNVLIGQEKTPLVIRVKVKATADKNEAVLVVRQFPNEEKFVLIDALPDKKKKLEYRMQIEVWKVGNKQIIDVVDITVFSFKAFDDAKNFLALDPAA
ncbi:hypothetical protein Bhyg_04413 [Pseudolycoriella hygida]|uniref:Uncharacterized protein n=1 Tax=Pseudolycoriella hygida TaxID=35572 RepID=A0A9Q0S8C2_9DIPT|nr:hypothetical protein Bhyg_04413 [Pseudolycoriella hygida]